MTTRSLRVLLLVAVLGTAPAPAASLQPAPVSPGGTSDVAIDPIRCWWRTSTGAVRTGETFSVVLTCAVVENDAVRVVPDESRLDPAVIALAPFEVVGGSHPSDLTNGQRRFFQYEYTLRVINRDAIGTDVDLPVLDIRYRVNSRTGANAALEGRDLLYLLPAQTIRVLSMVPAEAEDIRDTSDASFADVESLAFRARTLEIVALTLIAVGSVMALVALVRLVARTRRPGRSTDRHLGNGAVLTLVARELAEVQRESEQHGWTESLVGRALAASRVAAASAIGRAVSQQGRTSAQAGEHALVTRPWRGQGPSMAVSSSATAADVARVRAAMSATASPERRHLLESLQSAMTAFTVALYSRDAAMDRPALDAALATGLSLARRLRAEHMSPIRYVRRWAGRTPESEQTT